ncbi:hypothetical protein [Erwinia sp. ErVv1]|uniref:hypothetical protein n=1 Tax=Erwinia sp. ErVv1 TaxID=1603299 RepID=UPI00083675EA|nr:hypothetical protein [Erwinia sp. ErVv1]
MIFDFKKQRVDCHNNFPNRVLFKTEEKFHKLIEKNNGSTPFKPIKLNYDTDKTFQTCVGHLGDGLEFLPYRPDYMFDHCFKVVDEAGKSHFNSSSGVKGIVQGIGEKLLAAEKKDWSDIISSLCSVLPVITARFIVKRIFESEEIRIASPRDKKASLAKRAKACFNSQQYEKFIDKYIFKEKEGKRVYCKELAENPKVQLNAAKFIIMLLNDMEGKKIKSNYKELDLTIASNHIPINKKSEFITSVILYNIRNERAHGSTLSPFRTSKSDISRYQGYYFSMLCTYIFSLGLFQLRNYGGISASEIKSCCIKNVSLQKDFF